MANDEKVIKEFELYVKEFKPCCTTDGVELDMLKAVLELLKEQKEGVKPFHKCIGESHTLIEDSNFDYCPYCGRKLLWNVL
jgi:translation initiation factor 2 beta subunit (eIF-2beta)/eIF-5